MRVTAPGNGRMKVRFREWFTGGAQYASFVKVCSRSSVELANVDYLVGWLLLKILSTGRAIVAEVAPLCPSHRQKSPVCMVRKVVLKSHPEDVSIHHVHHMHTA